MDYQPKNDTPRDMKVSIISHRYLIFVTKKYAISFIFHMLVILMTTQDSTVPCIYLWRYLKIWTFNTGGCLVKMAFRKGTILIINTQK